MEAFHQSLARTWCGALPASCRSAVSLILVVSSPCRFLGGQSPHRSLGQSREISRAPGVPGGPGRPALGPVEEVCRSRAGPVCLYTHRPCTPPGEALFPPSNQATSFQPCGQQFLCTATWAGPPTAAVMAIRGRLGPENAGTV